VKTIQTVVAVEANGEIRIQIPPLPELQPGKHAATLLIEENGKPLGASKPLVLSRYAVGLKQADSALRREEIYGDDGR
jgi:hypothetical protein